MHPLLSEALDAHGGLAKWRSCDGLSSTIVSGGALWGMKGVHMDATPRVAKTKFRSQRTTIAPFGEPGWRMEFVPERVAILNGQDELVAGRDRPREAFAGHLADTAWDPLHLAYFNGYAMWLYHAAPFVLAEPGFEMVGIPALTQDGETLRGLRVRFPGHIHTHSTEQEFYFGPDGLLRRLDYQVQVAGGFGAAHMLSDYVDVDGLRFPGKRRAFTKAADGAPQLGSITVSVDLSNYALT
jgi:hypothetical protein